MKTVLIRPLLAVRTDTRLAETIPRGAAIEVAQHSPRGWIEITWDGLCFSVLPDDLIDACSVGDARRIIQNG